MVSLSDLMWQKQVLSRLLSAGLRLEVSLRNSPDGGSSRQVRTRVRRSSKSIEINNIVPSEWGQKGIREEVWIGQENIRQNSLSQSQVVLLADDGIDRLDNSTRLFYFQTAEAVTLVSSDHLELPSFDLFCEVVQVQLEFMFYLLPREISVGHHESFACLGNGQQPGLEISEEHLLFKGQFEEKGSLLALQGLRLSPLQFLLVQGRISCENSAKVYPFEQRTLLKGVSMDPLLRILPQTTFNQFSKIFIHTLIQGHILIGYLSENLHIICPFERVGPEMELICYDPECPDVTLLAILQSQCLRGEVVGRAYQRFPWRVRSLGDTSLGYPFLFLRRKDPLAYSGSPEVYDAYAEILSKDDVFRLGKGLFTLRSRCTICFPCRQVKVSRICARQQTMIFFFFFSNSMLLLMVFMRWKRSPQGQSYITMPMQFCCYSTQQTLITPGWESFLRSSTSTITSCILRNFYSREVQRAFMAKTACVSVRQTRKISPQEPQLILLQARQSLLERTLFIRTTSSSACDNMHIYHWGQGIIRHWGKEFSGRSVEGTLQGGCFLLYLRCEGEEGLQACSDVGDCFTSVDGLLTVFLEGYSQLVSQFLQFGLDL